jgi:hypothetical protein
MKKIEIQMLLYKLTKHFIEIQEKMLNAFGIILFYKMLCMFDGQDIGVKTRRPKFNPLYQNILCGVCIFIYVPCTCV